MHGYRAHGLSVSSEVELPLPPADRPADDPDVALRVGAPRSVPQEDAPGTLLATLRDDSGTALYTLARQADRTVLRYPGLCEFVADPELRRIEAHVHRGTDPGVVPVLAAASLLAVCLKVRGALLLHASAVQVGDRAVAFVGAAGMGKSTLAALFVTHGHRLVSDDLLRVDLGPATVYSGSTENRLRSNSSELADGATVAGMAPRTADGRLVLRSRSCSAETQQLAGCVVPLTHRDVEELSVTRLSTGRALVRLAQYPRVAGWIEPSDLSRDFYALADLVRVVPVFEARIPWGPPFAEDLPARLLAGMASPDWRENA